MTEREKISLEPKVPEPVTDPPKPSSETPPVIPEISTPPVEGPTRAENLITAQEGLIREQHQKLQDMEARLNKVENPPPPPISVEEQDKNFWQRPTQTQRELVREEIDQAVAPMRDYIAESSRTNKLEAVKARLSAQNPKLAEIIEKSSGYVDQLMVGQEINDQNVRAILYGIRGAAEVGDLPVDFTTGEAVKPIETPVPSADMTSIPPHLRPSAPPPATPSQPKVEVTLTENERRIARERGQSPEQFIRWRDMQPDEVAHSDFGQPKPKE